MSVSRLFSIPFLIVVLAAQTASDQNAANQPVLEKIGEYTFRLGAILVDTKEETVSVPGFVNPNVSVLEFFANSKGSFKNYESALELETDAFSFNTALLLIGLDNSNAIPARYPFQTEPPKGDPVEVWLEWEDVFGNSQKQPIEELVYNIQSKETLKPGKWVYTGSTFMDDGSYMAAMEQVLITFVHHPSPIIDYSGTDGAAPYGTLILNPNAGLAEFTPVTLTVRAAAKQE